MIQSKRWTYGYRLHQKKKGYGDIVRRYGKGHLPKRPIHGLTWKFTDIHYTLHALLFMQCNGIKNKQTGNSQEKISTAETSYEAQRSQEIRISKKKADHGRS